MNTLLDWRPYTLKVNNRAKITSLAPKTLNTPGNMTIKSGQPTPALYRKVENKNLRMARDPRVKGQSESLYSQDNIIQFLGPQVLPEDPDKLDKAVQKESKKMGMPGPLDTSIEAPARLFISPSQLASFAHLFAAVKRLEP